MPFSIPSTDKIIQVLPSKEDLYQKLIKIAKKPPKFNRSIPAVIYTQSVECYGKALAIIQKPAADYTYKELKEVLGVFAPGVSERLLSKLFVSAKAKANKISDIRFWFCFLFAFNFMFICICFYLYLAKQTKWRMEQPIWFGPPNATNQMGSSFAHLDLAD